MKYSPSVFYRLRRYDQYALAAYFHLTVGHLIEGVGKGFFRLGQEVDFRGHKAMCVLRLSFSACRH